jgi:DNA replication protein DnaC
VEPYIKAMLERVKKKMQNRPPMEPRHPEPQDGIYCDTCGCSGWVVESDGDHISMGHCPKCWERRQVVRRLKQSGINSKDYEKYTLESFDGGRSEMAGKMKVMAKRYLQDHIKGGPGIGIFGRSGMGKTHLCIAVCQELTRRFGEPHFYFSYRSEMPNLVKASRSFTDDYTSAMGKWKTCQNLYIDDLFKLGGKVENGRLVDVDREELRIIYDIINARYLNHLTTIISSEYRLNDITACDEAIGSRIWEMIKPYGLLVDGKNQRLGGTKK